MPEVIGNKNLDYLLNLTEDINEVVFEGSTRSGKTIAIFQFLILEAIENPNTIIRCFRHDGATHSSTTIPSFQFCMGPDMFDLWGKVGTFNKSEKVYSFTNGSKICFDSMNEPMKLHGKESDIAFINEAMEATFEAFTQINYRCRDLKIFDFNPSLNQHWIFSKILSKAKHVSGVGKKFMCHSSGVGYVHSTYKDNPCLTDVQVAAIESYDPDNPENVRNGTADAYLHDVYAVGKRGKVEGTIYKTYQVTEEWPERYLCQKWGYGLDFGFSADPMALAECRLYNNKLYVKEECYETDLLVTKNISKPQLKSLQHILEQKEVSKSAEIVADCARPDSIKDLEVTGYNVIPCEKGKDSILAGINILRGFQIMVHVDSNNLLMELEQYRWKRKQDGTWLQEPEDKNNHLLDGIRYWAQRNLFSAKNIMSQDKMRRTKAKVKSRVRARGRR